MGALLDLTFDWFATRTRFRVYCVQRNAWKMRGTSAVGGRYLERLGLDELREVGFGPPPGELLGKSRGEVRDREWKAPVRDAEVVAAVHTGRLDLSRAARPAARLRAAGSTYRAGFFPPGSRAIIPSAIPSWAITLTNGDF